MALLDLPLTSPHVLPQNHLPHVVAHATTMAVNFAAQPTVINPHPYQYSSRSASASQQPSPDSSAGSTPSNNSQSSLRQSLAGVPPHIAYQSRQLRPPKSPLYVPAVLRPTEPPSSRVASPPRQSRLNHGVNAPLTPPLSAGNSFDNSDDETIRKPFSPNKPNGFHTSNPLLRILGADNPAAGSISRVVTDEWMDNLGSEEVTGLPTKDHWKPDQASEMCNAPRCALHFSLLHRRHHCRRCGDIFCSECVQRAVPLDQLARFHPEGKAARACERCFTDYVTWDKVRRERPGSGSCVLATDDAQSVPKPCCGSFHSEGDEFGSKYDDSPRANNVETTYGSLNWSTF